MGTLYTRSSGKRRFAEVDLGFDGEKSVEHVHVLSRHMEQAPSVPPRPMPLAGGAVRSPASIFSAASSCVPGITCDYVSSVIPI